MQHTIKASAGKSIFIAASKLVPGSLEISVIGANGAMQCCAVDANAGAAVVGALEWELKQLKVAADRLEFEAQLKAAPVCPVCSEIRCDSDCHNFAVRG